MNNQGWVCQEPDCSGRWICPQPGLYVVERDDSLPKVKLSAVRPSQRTIASMPSTSIRPPSFVRVMVEALTPISFAT